MFSDFAARTRVSRILIIAAALALTAFSAADVRAASFDTLYSFPANGKHGSDARGSMVRDGKGALYGVTQFDGTGCPTCGVVYQLKPTASGPWKQKLLHNFSDADGARPTEGGLIMGPDGTLYGMTRLGGSLAGGTAFALAPPTPGQSQWTFETLHEFDGASANDRNPVGKLMLGADGALYGMSDAGSAGTVFRIKRTKTGWAYRALYHFTENVSPKGGLVADDQGRLYGLGNAGGANGFGVLFRLSPPASAGGDWIYKVLHNFSDDAADAAFPDGVLLLRDGALYGGALSNVSGEGSVVFRLTLPSSFAVIFRMDDATQGIDPGTGLAIDGAGAIYGVNANDGPGSGGTLFKLLPPASGNKWRFRLLHDFGDPPDGSSPFCQPLLDQNGNVYVNAKFGGAEGKGGVFVYRP